MSEALKAHGEIEAVNRDALGELINIAFHRAASSLSDIAGRRVDMAPPLVTLTPVGDLAAVLASHVPGELATIHQIFRGAVSGDALLVLDREGALRLVSLLTGEGRVGGLLSSEREVLMEVGNIILNSCLGIMGDVLEVHVSFAVPRLSLEDLPVMLKAMNVGAEELTHALVVTTAFTVEGGEVRGVIVLVFGVTALKKLLSLLDEWILRYTETGSRG